MHSISQSSSDADTLCRICLRETELLCVISSSDAVLYERFHELLSIRVEESLGQPVNICSNCLNMMEELQIFQRSSALANTAFFNAQTLDTDVPEGNADSTYVKREFEECSAPLLFPQSRETELSSDSDDDIQVVDVKLGGGDRLSNCHGEQLPRVASYILKDIKHTDDKRDQQKKLKISVKSARALKTNSVQGEQQRGIKWQPPETPDPEMINNLQTRVTGLEDLVSNVVVPKYKISAAAIEHMRNILCVMETATLMPGLNQAAMGPLDSSLSNLMENVNQAAMGPLPTPPLNLVPNVNQAAMGPLPTPTLNLMPNVNQAAMGPLPTPPLNLMPNVNQAAMGPLPTPPLNLMENVNQTAMGPLPTPTLNLMPNVNQAAMGPLPTPPLNLMENVNQAAMGPLPTPPLNLMENVNQAAMGPLPSFLSNPIPSVIPSTMGPLPLSTSNQATSDLLPSSTSSLVQSGAHRNLNASTSRGGDAHATMSALSTSKNLRTYPSSLSSAASRHTSLPNISPTHMAALQDIMQKAARTSGSTAPDKNIAELQDCIVHWNQPKSSSLEAPMPSSPDENDENEDGDTDIDEGVESRETTPSPVLKVVRKRSPPKNIADDQQAESSQHGETSSDQPSSILKLKRRRATKDLTWRPEQRIPPTTKPKPSMSKTTVSSQLMGSTDHVSANPSRKISKQRKVSFPQCGLLSAQPVVRAKKIDDDQQAASSQHGETSSDQPSSILKLKRRRATKDLTWKPEQRIPPTTKPKPCMSRSKPSTSKKTVSSQTMSSADHVSSKPSEGTSKIINGNITPTNVLPPHDKRVKIPKRYSDYFLSKQYY